MKSDETPRFAYFGTPDFAVYVLDELAKEGFLPHIVITAPDKPRGRRLVITPSDVKIWAEGRSIRVLTPEKLSDPAFIDAVRKEQCDFFIVAAYGKIMPSMVLRLPPYGTINVHPSLLPKFRGASPIESVILSDETETGVTVIQLDEEMDHGPIVRQQKLKTDIWPPKGSELARALATLGGKLLAEILRQWPNKQQTTPQNHADATYTKKIAKEDGLVDLLSDPYANYKKICAFDRWPGAYFFDDCHGKKTRIRISDAAYADGKLTITRVIPEGKKEMHYADYLRGRR